MNDQTVAAQPVGSLSPGSSPAAAPAVSGAPMKKTQFQGPCYMKLLVNNVAAGSIIGKNGAVISSIESQANVCMRLSPASCYFPGTNERVVVMSGGQEQIHKGILIVLDKMQEAAVQMESRGVDAALGNGASAQSGKMCVKIVVPKSAVSAIIGKQGQQIKRLQDETGAKAQISAREENFHERVCTVTGTMESLRACCTQISTLIQNDQFLKDHMYVVYNNQVNPAAAQNVFQSTAAAAPMSAAPPFQQQNHFAPNFPPQYQQQAQFARAVPPPQNEVMNQQCEICMQMPDQFVGPVIGKNGANLTEILQLSGARIQISQKGELIPGTQNRRVTVMGSVHAVHNAHVMLLQRLHEVQAQAKQAAAGMGPGGAANVGGDIAMAPPQSQHGGIAYMGQTHTFDPSVQAQTYAY